MKPRDFPTGRAAKGGDKPVAIDMSLDEPEEAGAIACSPSQTTNYEPEEEAQMMMAEAKADKVEAGSPEYKAPGSLSPSREQSPIPPVLNAYYTQNFRPKQVYGPRPVPKVTPSTLGGRGRRTRWSETRKGVGISNMTRAHQGARIRTHRREDYTEKYDFLTVYLDVTRCAIRQWVIPIARLHTI